MAPATRLLSRLGLASATAVGLYAVILGLLLTPNLQRFALYAHKINTLFLGDDLCDGESFGFAKNQVTPFELRTPDGETLFAWHVLPIDVYARHQDELIREERRKDAVVDEDFTKTRAFGLLGEEGSRVVVTFHGNAGHLAQQLRTESYRLLVTQPNTHVLTIDYRGFGLSTGSPTEAGLIADGTALLDWILDVVGIPPERIVILGQSLGTAVSSAVALHFADPGNDLIPKGTRELRPVLANESVREPIVFAGVVLVAPFSSLPSLMLTYRIGGLLPILLPLRPFPGIAGMLTGRMVDKWLSADRLAAYYQALASRPQLLKGVGGRSMGSFQVFHSRRDMDIPFHQTEMICAKIFGEGKEVECIDGREAPGVVEVEREGRARVRFEIVEYGGHNRIITHTPVAVGVVRAFEDIWR